MKKRTAVCCIVKNEEKFIKEWICFHIAIGFDTVIIYDNESTDKTAEIIKKLGRIFDVRYFLWGRHDFYYQIDCYKDCIERNKVEFRWLAFLDADEFVVPYGHKNIHGFLKNYEYAACLVVNWAIFGSSGFKQSPDGLVTENFLWRSDVTFYNNRHVKSFINPKKFINCYNAHFFEVSGRTINVQHQNPEWKEKGIISTQPIYTQCQINHYYCKSRDDYYKKIRRGYPDIKTSHFTEEDLNYGFGCVDKNEQYDVNIFYNMENLKNILKYVDKFEGCFFN